MFSGMRMFQSSHCLCKTFYFSIIVLHTSKWKNIIRRFVVMCHNSLTCQLVRLSKALILMLRNISYQQMKFNKILCTKTSSFRYSGFTTAAKSRPTLGGEFSATYSGYVCINTRSLSDISLFVFISSAFYWKNIMTPCFLFLRTWQANHVFIERGKRTKR